MVEEIYLFIIIFFVFTLSSIGSFLILRKRGNKWYAIGIAFAINSILLVISCWILYRMNEEARLFGLGITNYAILLSAIPVITWMNGIIIASVYKQKG